MHLVKTKLNTKNLKVYVRAYIKMVWALFFLVAKITSSLMKKLKGEISMNNGKIVKHIHWGANNSYQNNYVIGSSMVERRIFRRSRVRIPFYFFYHLFSFTRKEKSYERKNDTQKKLTKTLDNR